MDMLSIFTFVVFGVIAFRVGVAYSDITRRVELNQTNEIFSMMMLEFSDHLKIPHTETDNFVTGFRIKLQSDDQFKRYLNKKYKGV